MDEDENEDGDGENGRKKSRRSPTARDWNNCRIFLKFLKLFYNATKRFSGSLFVTSNCFFDEMFVIQTKIEQLIKKDDKLLSTMAQNMKEKFEKYWGNGEKINLLVYVASNEEKFDILGWWKVNSSKYRVLSQVARDVLAIPVSTVASESAFSTGGRILDPFRSSLSPMMVEALICTQNWLQSIVPISLRKAMDDVEELEQYDPVALSELASTSNPSPNIITL
ncbi:zinc finger BED domain-containing protein RICESLEEPER 2-like isoform X2 [Camellia sinensis]|uniref:zinc finger BED domain-containing protein RICESLEEPER 2-like isoform X2 n=1 Tax=Camellia sinensis TaxID=4442 RepID=UPI001036199C|nr:zinc finger BED domain-containing protein RICESLEEPER 2-like isoform X2 [Camellia sinensis]